MVARHLTAAATTCPRRVHFARFLITTAAVPATAVLESRHFVSHSKSVEVGVGAEFLKQHIGQSAGRVDAEVRAALTDSAVLPPAVRPSHTGNDCVGTNA